MARDHSIRDLDLTLRNIGKCKNASRKFFFSMRSRIERTSLARSCLSIQGFECRGIGTVIAHGPSRHVLVLLEEGHGSSTFFARNSCTSSEMTLAQVLSRMANAVKNNSTTTNPWPPTQDQPQK